VLDNDGCLHAFDPARRTWLRLLFAMGLTVEELAMRFAVQLEHRWGRRWKKQQLGWTSSYQGRCNSPFIRGRMEKILEITIKR
jgi:hypothetical protein